MVVRLRLQRYGIKHRPFYRIVAADARAPRDGKFVERLGTFDPIPSKDGTKEIRVNVERARYWVSVGAQPSDRVRWLFGKMGVLPPAPVRQSNPAAFGIPKSVFQELQKAKEEVRAEHAKKAKKLLEDRKKAKLARMKERREKRIAAKTDKAKSKPAATATA